MVVNTIEHQDRTGDKSKPKIGTRGYQYRVLDKLVKEQKISPLTAQVWKVAVTVGEVTKFGGVNIDFVTDQQTGIVNIARKVHQDQISLLLNMVGKVGGDQFQMMGLQGAGNVGENQVQSIGLQGAGNVEGNQDQWIGLQGAGNVEGNQDQIMGLQGVVKVGGDQKSQVMSAGVSKRGISLPNWMSSIGKFFSKGISK